MAIDRAEVSGDGIGPLIPDADAVLLEVVHVSVSPEEPEKLVDDGLEVQFLRGKQWKALFQVETHLVAEYTEGTRAGAVSLLDSLVQNAPQEVLILFHC
jgi:hypothetical protein